MLTSTQYLGIFLDLLSCRFVHIYIYIDIYRYIYIYTYVYMYHWPPQTLHLFSSQIKQSCHTCALLGPAKICQEGLLNAVMLNLRFIHLPPARKKKLVALEAFPGF